MKIVQENALQKIANRIRYNVVQEVYNAKSGHLGGSLSIAEILAVLYFNEMNIDPLNPRDMDRDRFILSKGHASCGLYAILAERGYFPKEELQNFRKINSNLQGHPDMNKVCGVDMSTGSLGQGLSVANGMAIAAKINNKEYRVYCLLGDGELEEGQIWEACMTASKYKLDNLCVIVDCNNLQLTGNINDVKGLDSKDIENKFKSFGFNTISINGNNIKEILEAFKESKTVKEMPTVIIANTVKGKGISFMENKAEWHGKTMNDEEYKEALEELKNIMSDNNENKDKNDKKDDIDNNFFESEIEN